MTPVPGHGRQIDRRQRQPAAGRSCAVTVQPLNSAPLHAVDQRAAADAHAGRVLRPARSPDAADRNSDGPRSASRSQPVLRDEAGSRGGLRSVARTRNAAALSVAFASVYCTVAVSPLRSRRRTWIWPAFRSDVPFDVR